MNPRSISILTLLKIISALLSLVYSIVQARIFGTSYEIEIYFAANSLVYLISSLTQTGQLAEVFLPVYHQLSAQNGTSMAQGAFSIVLNRIIIFVLLALAATYFLTPALVSLMVPGFDNEAKLFTIDMFRVMLLYIVFDLVNSFINVLLNAENVFGRAEFNGIIHTSISLILLWLLFPYTGIWTLVIAQFTGKVIGVGTSVYFLRKIKYKHSFTWSIVDFDHSSFFKTIYTTTRYVLATQLFNIALTSSLSLLPQGIYAIFKYVEMLYTRTVGILIQPISIVFFTHASMLVSSKRGSELMNVTKQLTTLTILLGLVVLSIELVVGEETLTLLWGNTAFEKGSIKFAYSLLSIYFLVFLGEGVGVIYRRLAISLGYANKYYALLTLIQLLCAGIAFFAIRNLDIKGLLLTVFITRSLFIFAPVAVLYINQKKYLQPANKNILFKVLAAAVAIQLLLYHLKFNILNILRFRENSFILFFTIIALSILVIALMASLLYVSKSFRIQFQNLSSSLYLKPGSYKK